MPVAVIISPTAAGDLSQVFEYIESNSPLRAPAALRELRRAIESLAEFPRKGRPRRRRRKSDPEVRVVLVSSFKVYYRVTHDQVDILRVWHAARRPPSVRDLHG